MTEPTYEIGVSRRPSDDFLEDVQGALLQAQVESVARELRHSQGRPLQTAHRVACDEVSLVLSAPDPGYLHELAGIVSLRYGHELPDPAELPPERAAAPLSTRSACYSARDHYAVVGAMLVEAVALAFLHQALERERLNDEDGLAAAYRADARAYRRLSERIGVSPPARDSVDLQAARALLDAVPQESFLGVEIAGDGGHAVLALLKEKDLITEHEAITAALSLG